MVLTEFQRQLLSYINEGRFVDYRIAGQDLGVSKSKVFSNLQLLIAAGLIVKQSSYRLKE